MTWPESMTLLSPSDVDPASASASNLPPEANRSRSTLALLLELEKSLERSCTALLEGDLAMIDRATWEQARLCAALVPLMKQDNGTRSGESNPEPPTAAALRQAQTRVLDQARVQAALLVRAQRALKIVSNLLSAPLLTYESAVNPACVTYAKACQPRPGEPA